jgi:L-alanine-DL-glutamate epimerase-like enolase superfamily enzyme
MVLTQAIESLRLKAPFRISGYTFYEGSVVLVTLTEGGHTGRGEANGVYYLKDEPDTFCRTIEAHREVIERGITRAELSKLLPAGGARNALDCALWDLESKRTGRPVWQLAGLPEPCVPARSDMQAPAHSSSSSTVISTRTSHVYGPYATRDPTCGSAWMRTRDIRSKRWLACCRRSATQGSG